MALRRVFNKKFKGVMLKSGHVYTFKYQSWENDPHPTAIMLYSVEGIHPRTGHQHRYIQMINFTYVPRVMRRQFAKDWVREFNRTNGNIRLTWEIIKVRYPYLQHAVRRYFFKPNYYISDLKEVPFEDIERLLFQHGVVILVSV